MGALDKVVAKVKNDSTLNASLTEELKYCGPLNQENKTKYKLNITFFIYKKEQNMTL